MLGGGDIVPVPRVVRAKSLIEGVGMDRRHLGDGVRVDAVSFLPPFVSSPSRPCAIGVGRKLSIIFVLVISISSLTRIY